MKMHIMLLYSDSQVHLHVFRMSINSENYRNTRILFLSIGFILNFHILNFINFFNFNTKQITLLKFAQMNLIIAQEQFC